MKFLFILPCFSYGGAEKQAAILACRVADLGGDVEAWAFPSAGGTPLKSALERKGINCRILPRWPRLDWRKFKVSRSPRSRLFAFIWWKLELSWEQLWLPREVFDVIIPFTFWPCLIAALFHKRFGHPVVIWNHRGGLDDAGVDYSSFIIREILRARLTFVSNSNAGCKFLSSKFGVTPEEVKLVRNAFVTSDYCLGVVPQLHVSEKKTYTFVHVANFAPEKDIETVLKAAQLLLNDGVKFRLHVIGEGRGNLRSASLRETVERMGLTSHVIVRGALEPSDIQELLKNSDIGMLSSRSEGCPNCVMEYMYYGLPVVGTNIPGIRDLVGVDGHPYLFEVGNETEFKNCIMGLIENPQLRRTLGAANKKRVVEMFGVDMMIDDWVSVLSSVIENPFPERRDGKQS